MRSGAGVLLVFTLNAAGCGHVLHPAAVVPGLVLDLQVGVERPEHRPIPNAADPRSRKFGPYRTSEFLLHGGLTYGWRLSELQALQLGIAVGNITGATLDFYWQFLGGGLDAGVGVTTGIGILLSGYGMAGRAFDLGSDRQLRIDGGYRVAPWVDHFSSYATTAHGPIALLSFVSSPVSFGLWLDHLWLSKTIFGNNCDDLCGPEDTVNNRVSLGAFVRFQP